MANGKEREKLVRTSILVDEDTDRALRELADRGKRPLSWEIRQALTDHVDANRHRLDQEPAAA